ncbi:MAG: FIST C-terminal domain-containing protein [Planctomycetes bacterium]|nr:FIST C-terminal domain-containing protein [Planctomycetota bacterium]
MDAPLFSSALSRETDAKAAIEAAARELMHGLRGYKPDLLSVFVSHHHGSAIEHLGQELHHRTGARHVIGCTGESIVGSTVEVEGGPALSLWAGVLPRTEVRPFTVEVGQTDSGTLAFSALPEVIDRSRASLLLLGDPFAFPASPYLEILNSELPGVECIGGMASGGSGPGQNLVFTEHGIADAAAIGVVIEGEIEVRSIVSQGCRPIGKPWVITACKDNFVLRLGAKKSLEVLMETMSSLSDAERERFSRQPFLGLAIDPRKSVFTRGDFLVRGLMGIDPQQGAIAVGDGSIRVGMTVQFLVRDAQTAGEDLVHLMQERASGATGAPENQGALLFSCNGRGVRMFGSENHDIGCVQSVFEKPVPAAGFFAAGEIGPVGGHNFVHGFTASVALFRARS